MLIVCPACTSAYEIADAKLGAAGRTVRCKKCATTWFARPELAAATPPAMSDAVTPTDANPTLAQTIEPAPTSAHDDFDAAVATFGAPRDQVDGLSTEELDSWTQAFAEVQEDETRAAAGVAKINVAAARPPADPIKIIDNVGASTGRHPKRARRKAATSSPFRRVADAAAAAAFGSMALLAFAIAFRVPIAHALPASERLFASFGMKSRAADLAIDTVTSNIVKAGSSEFLVVEGMIRNVSRKASPVSDIRLSIQDASNVELYSWTTVPPRRDIAPGEAIAFRARLAAPPSGGQRIEIRMDTVKAVPGKNSDSKISGDKNSDGKISYDTRFDRKASAVAASATVSRLALR